MHVHHIDHNKENNNFLNLVLIQQGVHLTYHKTTDHRLFHLHADEIQIHKYVQHERIFKYIIQRNFMG